MSDDQNTTQNPISEENSLPTSPQEPTEPALKNTAHSEPADAPPEALESSLNDFPVKSNDIPPSDSTPTEAENEPKTEEKQAENETTPEPVSESVEAPESETAQIPVNEALPESEPSVSEAKEEPKSQTTEAKPPVATSTSFALALLVKARNAIQFRKRKKLDRVMSLFLKKSKITNDEVEKFLHVSDATATRYLSQLELEGKVKQNGKTGKGVIYTKI
jgi:hypothetical protein